MNLHNNPTHEIMLKIQSPMVQAFQQTHNPQENSTHDNTTLSQPIHVYQLNSILHNLQPIPFST